jgi:hypothetical protein
VVLILYNQWCRCFLDAKRSDNRENKRNSNWRKLLVMTNWKQTNIHHSQNQALEARKFEEQQEQLSNQNESRLYNKCGF